MLIIFIALVVILAALFIENYLRPKDFPPGPFRFPLIGSWYCVPSQGIHLKVSKWRQKYGNIIGHKIGRRNLVLIAGYEEMASALKNSNFQQRNHSKTQTIRTFHKILGLFTADGKQYNEVRRFTFRFLSHITATRLESITHEEMSNWFSTIRSGEITQVFIVCNSVHERALKVDNELVFFMANIFFTFLIGDSKKMVQNEMKTLSKLVQRSFKTGRPSGIEHFYPLLGIFIRRGPQFVAIKYVQSFFKDRLNEHRKSFNPENITDYIDAFLVEQEKEKKIGKTEYYSDEELISCLLDMGQASTDSTNNTALYLLLYVALNPRVQDKMHKELDTVLGNRSPVLEDKLSLPYCIAVIEETMRIDLAPATAVQHIASQDTKFYRYTIPRGTMIIFPLWDMFRNPDEFEDPDSFKPERFTSNEIKSKIISFGLGKRTCVAESLARKTLFLIVTHFFQKYSISLPKGHKSPDTEPLLGFTSSPKPFPLIITERQSK